MFKPFCLEKSSIYLNQKKFHEAYGMLDCLHKYGQKVLFIPVLINYHASLMQTNRTEEAEKIRNELIALLEENLDESSRSYAYYANRLLKEKKVFKSLLFYELAAYFCENDEDSENSIGIPQLCCQGLIRLASSLLKETSNGKYLVKKYVIPCIDKCIGLVIVAASMNLKLSSMAQARCLQCKSLCFLSLRDLEESEKCLREGTKKMEKFLKEGVVNYQLYGSLLKTLGVVVSGQNKHEEAVKILKSSVEAIRQAKDFTSTFEKLRQVKEYEKELEKAQKKLKDNDI